MLKYLYLLILSIAILSSCNRDRFTYIRNNEVKNFMEDTTFRYNRSKVDYIIQPNDYISIQIITLNDEVNQYYRIENSNIATMPQRVGRNAGFMVNDSGFIVLPIIGELKVGGLNITDAKQLILEAALNNFEYARVNIHLLDYDIYFLGEVNNPGVVNVFSDKVNLLEAFALTGGLTEYAKRNEILIMRTTIDGYVTYRVDITDRKIIESEQFFLMPNDIVIVEPVRYKLWRSYFNDYQFYLSVVTTAITSLTLINSLK